MATKSYDASAIKHLGYVESVRAKPTLYIGSTDEAGVFTILREVTDNVVDEALGGHATQCQVYIDDDGSYWVVDDGRGMPVGKMKVQDTVSGTSYTMPAIQAITSLLHAGGKLDADSAYETSRGTHGIGIKATNFLSTYFDVWTFNQGSWWTLGYKKGKLETELVKCKAPSHPFLKGNLAKGTMIHFAPDAKVFSASRFPMSMLDEWATIAAYFTPNFRVKVAHHSGKSRDYYFEHGPREYAKNQIAKLKTKMLVEGVPPIVHRSPLADVVVAFTEYDGCDLAAFTNGLGNPDKGVHWQSVIQALDKAIRVHAKPKQTFTVAELRDGIVGLVNAKLSAPKFSSQTKEKLADPRAAKPLQDELAVTFDAFFKKNKQVALRVIERCCALAKLKTQFLASKTVLKDLAAVKKKGLPAKAFTSPNCRPEDRELYLVEGDSAAGTARSARDARYQEIMPLKGKIMNALRNAEASVLASEEVLQILTLIGFDPKAEDPLSKLRVGKIIQLADPDPDGPLVGSTHVTIVGSDNQWRDVPIAELCESEEFASNENGVMPWRVVTYSQERRGYSYATPSATHVFEHEDGHDLIHITWSDGSKNVCTPNHKWLVYRRDNERIDLRRVASHGGRPIGEEPQFLKAATLKAGDMILRHTTVGSASCRPAFVTVTKVRAKASPACKVYCLSVPGTYNFRLSSGVMSGNCHINALLLSLFYKFMPGLFDRGLVFIAEAPEFYAELKSGKPVFGASLKEVKAQLADLGEPTRMVNHIKGYGELEPDLLRLITFDPATRTLSRIMVTDSKDGAEFVKVMSDDVQTRKQLLGI